MSESTQPDFTTPLKVVVSFNYTIDDLREGLAPPAQDQRKKKSHASLFGWIAFLGLAVVIFAVLQRRALLVAPVTPLPPAAPPGIAPLMTTPPPRFIDARLLVVPSATAALCIATLLTGLIVTARLGRSKSLRVRTSSGYAFVASAVTCALIFWLGSTLLGSGLFYYDIEPDTAPVMFIVWSPWLVVLVGLIVLGVVLNRGALQRQWNKKKSYQRPRTVELNEHGLRNSDEMGDNFYRWPYFHRAWETPNVLVLLDESDLRHIVPKRALEEVGGLDSARSLIGSHIADTKFLTQPVGFPVRPIAVPPPIPRA